MLLKNAKYKSCNLYYHMVQSNISNWRKIPLKIRNELDFQKNVILLKPRVFKKFSRLQKTQHVCLFAITIKASNIEFVPQAFLYDVNFLQKVLEIQPKCIQFITLDKMVLINLIRGNSSIVKFLQCTDNVKEMIIVMLNHNLVPHDTLNLLPIEFFKDIDFFFGIIQKIDRFPRNIYKLFNQLSLKQNEDYMIRFIKIDPTIIGNTLWKYDKDFILKSIRLYSKINPSKYCVIFNYIHNNLKNDNKFVRDCFLVNPLIIEFMKSTQINFESLDVLFNYVIQNPCVNISWKCNRNLIEKFVIKNLSINYLIVYMKLIFFKNWKLKWIIFFLEYATDKEVKENERLLLLYKKIKPSIVTKMLSRNIEISCIDNECPICLDITTSPVVPVNKYKNTCYHIFCRDCLDKVKHNTCPICRMKYQKSVKIDVYRKNK